MSEAQLNKAGDTVIKMIPGADNVKNSIETGLKKVTGHGYVRTFITLFAFSYMSSIAPTMPDKVRCRLFGPGRGSSALRFFIYFAVAFTFSHNLILSLVVAGVTFGIFSVVRRSNKTQQGEPAKKCGNILKDIEDVVEDTIDVVEEEVESVVSEDSDEE